MSRSSFKILVAMTALTASLAHLPASAQVEIAGTPSPVGSGARAAGMGDAFVAIADDATAASWNPAGLVQLERPEFSIVGAYNSQVLELTPDYRDREAETIDDDNLDLNYLSIAYPLPITLAGRNATVSLNYQRKYDFTRKLKLKHYMPQLEGSPPVNEFLYVDFEQEGGLSTLTPAFAIELTQRLAVGVAVNFWRSSFLGENSWEQTTRQRRFRLTDARPVYTTEETKEEYEDFSGENATLGVMWNITDRWSLGARYDTAFTGRANYTRTKTTLVPALNESQTRAGQGLSSPVSFANFLANADPFSRQEPRDIRFPSAIALGVAHRFNDRFTLSMDITRIDDWDEFWVRGRSRQRISLINTRNFDDILMPPRFEPTYTVRLGGEYVFLPKYPQEELDTLWSVRAGLSYDQEPATHEPDNFWGLALGVGLLTKQRVNVDLAYQIRFGDDVNADYVYSNSYLLEGYNEDVIQHRVVLSTVIYF